MSNKKDTNQAWGGRFNEATDDFVAKFTASVEFDQKLALHDIQGSLAHAEMLTSIDLLSPEELAAIKKGFSDIRMEIEAGTFEWHLALEDVHMNLEAALTEKIGDIGKKLHTGRSRNDQVATDLRLWLRDEIDLISKELSRLQRALVDLAEKESATIMPGFTHLQTAQPITFGHHLMAWFEMLDRDHGRLIDCRRRTNHSPLGAAALAGTTYPINRKMTATLLGFDEPMNNSLDAVSDRDFAIEFCSFASILMTHLSRASEELILWNSAQFNFIDLPDRFCTGSSIMPQKKNPDVPELVRGKTGRVNGNLIALLTLMKSQPLAYNKDNQEDKEPLFDTVATVKDCLRALANMVPAIKSNQKSMTESARRGFATATDLADYLVRKNIAFRDSHEIVGKAVAYGLSINKDLSEMSLSELQQFSTVIEADVFNVLTLEGSVAARNHIGGTAPKQVRLATKAARKKMGAI
ncbi:MAG: argininosuccinate lyase [Porticoccus sp.]|nr:argininosuccinate lyase [Porticoccus sp.]|tara:strand:- start:3456 stop:4853 length:1398 start_codon:yes stop_codon:yes gene_type:complete